MGQRDDFERQLARGKLGEKLVAAFLRQRGYGVIPSYAFTGTNGDKAPRLMFVDRGLVIPDLDICKSGQRFWCEIKTYRAPARNRAHGCDVHGIPQRLRRHYERCEEATGNRVSIAVLEVLSGWLLLQRLVELEDWPCQCRACADGRGSHCLAASTGIREGTYWPRASMREVHRFPAGDMLALREEWTT